MHTVILSIIAYAACCALNVVIAKIERDIVEYRMRIGDTNQIEHGPWSFIYCVAIAPAWLIGHSWILMLSLLLCHYHVFGSVYQLMSGNNIFYLSKTSKAVSEKLMIRIGLKSLEIPYIISFALSIFLLIKSIA